MPDNIDGSPDTGANEPQPGQVITPGSVSAPPPTPPLPAAQPSPAPQPAQSQPVPVAPPVPPTPPPAESQYVEEQPASIGDPVSDGAIAWTASEYVEHEKNASWYLLLGVVAVALAALLFLITRDLVSVVVVIFGALALGIYAARPPQQIAYQLDKTGLTIGQKHFAYEVFRTFSVVPEGGITSIVFVHHKRFAPLTTIYLAPDQEDAVVTALTSRLPLEEHKIDAVEHLMRRIRF